jgi:Ni,Fe-hydrogenase maturation factor
MDAQLKKKEIEIEIHMTTLKQKIEMMSNFKKMSEETKEKLEKAEETNVKIEKRLGILE